ncbi:MAG: hypothetical protein U0Q12_01340 [Vicinamibacterales bacterium]
MARRIPARAAMLCAAVAAVAILRVDIDARSTATGSSVAPGDDVLSKADADALARKIQDISGYAGGARAPRLITVSEREVNAYLKFGDKLPAGVLDPKVTILGDGRLSARALVDLDTIKQRRQPTGFFDPLSLLGGKVPVSAVGVLRTQAGVGRFELESTDVGGIPVPKTVLQELVNVYSRTPDHPTGFDIDAPFELPARIVEIRVSPQSAVVVQ